ncbi:MAG: MEMO1 family protein [Candidatus Nitrosocaldus sp.]
MKVRRPAVAGIFYPADGDKLLDAIDECFHHPLGPLSTRVETRVEHKVEGEGKVDGRKIIGIVSPHAAYMYSGAVAAHSYHLASLLKPKPDLIVMLGPNHYGLGSAIATMVDCYWETPLGKVPVNSDEARRLVRLSGILDIDDYAHSRDHCLEVQLPMLQYIYKHEFSIIPILLWMQDKDTASDLGNAIAELIESSNMDVLLIASSDLTHYEHNDEAYRKDGELIKTILALDVARYYTVLERLDVSACGYGAIGAVMVAAKRLGATSARLLKYATSGDITGDKSAVVGYASIAFIG